MDLTSGKKAYVDKPAKPFLFADFLTEMLWGCCPPDPTADPPTHTLLRCKSMGSICFLKQGFLLFATFSAGVFPGYYENFCLFPFWILNQQFGAVTVLFPPPIGCTKLLQTFYSVKAAGQAKATLTTIIAIKIKQSLGS